MAGLAGHSSTAKRKTNKQTSFNQNTCDLHHSYMMPTNKPYTHSHLSFLIFFLLHKIFFIPAYTCSKAKNP
jgi:hypothetical protein